VCYIAVGLATGWAATRLFWPATASALFRERAVKVVERCRQALVEHEPGAGRERWASALFADYAKQRLQMGPLSEQARHEPVERALDADRRRALVALLQDLVDALQAARGPRPGEPLDVPGSAAALFEPLSEAHSQVGAALLASLKTSAAALQGAKVAPNTALQEALDRVLQELQALRRRPEAAAALTGQDRETLLAQLDSRHQLITRQLAIEAWVSDWLQTRA